MRVNFVEVARAFDFESLETPPAPLPPSPCFISYSITSAPHLPSRNTSSGIFISGFESGDGKPDMHGNGNANTILINCGVHAVQECSASADRTQISSEHSWGRRAHTGEMIANRAIRQQSADLGFHI